MPKPILEMFDSIAPWYDFLNRLLSLRRDVYWRRFTADRIRLGETCRVLDVACGTCDIALEVLRSQPCVNRVFGVDFSPKMLSKAKKKTGDTNQKIQLGLADALNLPFKDASFDNCIIAFGVRNIVSRREALEEMARILVTGGQVMVLEFATPKRRLLKNFYLFYLNQILPFIGGFFSKNKNAYQYLSDTILSFPDPVKFTQLMEEAGLKDVTYHKLTFGIVNLHIGRKA